MSEQKFKGTPGPWRVHGNPIQIMIVDQAGRAIAELWNKNTADGNLMKAAPDLLEAAQKAESILSVTEPHSSMLKALRAAIAKALGDE